MNRLGQGNRQYALTFSHELKKRHVLQDASSRATSQLVFLLSSPFFSEQES
jgi:hypothetical protein